MSHSFCSRHFMGWLQAGWDPGMIASAKLWAASRVREKHTTRAEMKLCLNTDSPTHTPA